MVCPSANWSSPASSGVTILLQSVTRRLYDATKRRLTDYPPFGRLDTARGFAPRRLRPTTDNEEGVRMVTADEALSREVQRGMTRQDILKRAAALGIVVSGGTLGPLTEAAFARTQIKRGGTFRQATSGGSTDFIDGQHIVAKSDIARLVAGFE